MTIAVTVLLIVVFASAFLVTRIGLFKVFAELWREPERRDD